MNGLKMVKRDVFAELMEGISAMKQYREDKVTAQTYKRPTSAVGLKELPRLVPPRAAKR